MELGRRGEEPGTGSRSQSKPHRSVPALWAAVGSARPTAARARDEAEGSGARSVLTPGPSADFDVVLEPAAIRRFDRMGQQSFGSRSASFAGTRTPRRRLLEEG